MSFISMSVSAKKVRKSEVLEGILERMETEGGVEDWGLWMPLRNEDIMTSAFMLFLCD